MPACRADANVTEDWPADFERRLQAPNRAPETIKVYLRSVRQLLEHVRASHAVDEPFDAPVG